MALGEYPNGEAELREFLAARVWSSLEGPRALFDRAVVWLVNNRVLLPGVTTLARKVGRRRRRRSESAGGRGGRAAREVVRPARCRLRRRARRGSSTSASDHLPRTPPPAGRSTPRGGTRRRMIL
ncbi:DUF4158 domain-containing protein [Microtetraspora fusca]|uniref:DUF4158 domain-containing protein n=1 Tax=Microtetraspora fusca TaxID=1997 RepID=A0ABW6UX28_MICFU